MSELRDHERDERLERERPEVSHRRTELRVARERARGELRGIIRGIALARLGLRLARMLRRRRD